MERATSEAASLTRREQPQAECEPGCTLHAHSALNERPRPSWTGTGINQPPYIYRAQPSPHLPSTSIPPPQYAENTQPNPPAYHTIFPQGQQQPQDNSWQYRQPPLRIATGQPPRGNSWNNPQGYPPDQQWNRPNTEASKAAQPAQPRQDEPPIHVNLHVQEHNIVLHSTVIEPLHIVAVPREPTYTPPVIPPFNDYYCRAMLAAVCCFLPLGVLAVFKAKEAREAIKAGREWEAYDKSLAARKWANGAIIAGLITYGFVGVIAFYFIALHD